MLIPFQQKSFYFWMPVVYIAFSSNFKNYGDTISSLISNFRLKYSMKVVCTLYEIIDISSKFMINDPIIFICSPLIQLEIYWSYYLCKYYLKHYNVVVLVGGTKTLSATRLNPVLSNFDVLADLLSSISFSFCEFSISL